ncbi:hypothetical protein [Bythopirellula goksoeyrii]|uniref:WD domain, G-beta repeat n=1 Tax=Bythopirellula goksoeyrii TaxID=1400387 RepID=A0A5B9QEX5_9BACT|nr:hypothetical protein [Bythopirellula goksoeyrii]QEG36155.1 hypothetical protein Pr1d_34640 [Bythopirellula goksoeyrii]
MKVQLFGKDWSLSWRSLGTVFWLFVFTGLIAGTLRALIEPHLRYVDLDWRLEPNLPRDTSTISPLENLAAGEEPIQSPTQTADPLTQLIQGATGPGQVVLPKIIPLAQELAFCRFYLGRDFTTCFCSGEPWFQVEWEDRAYRCRGQFVDLTQPLGEFTHLKPLDIRRSLQASGSFQGGPAPGVAGYEQLSEGSFRYAVGEITNPVSGLSTLSYARKGDWLSFPSKFAAPAENSHGPWSMYQSAQRFPWIGIDYAANLKEGTLTAVALTHEIDTQQFPLAWQGPPSATTSEWLAGDAAGRLAPEGFVASYTNYQHGLVAAAFQLPQDRCVLLLYSAHAGNVLAVNPLPFGAQATAGRSLSRLQFSPNGWLLAAYDQAGELYFFHTKTLKLLRHYPQTDGRENRHKTVRLAFNSRGDRLIAPSKGGDLIEVDFFANRLQRLGCKFPVSAFAYATSYDQVDTLMTVSAESGWLVKYRLDQGTAAREAKFLLAGLYPKARYLNFSEDGSQLCGIVSEATGAWHEPPTGKPLRETESRLLVWDFSGPDWLDPVPRSPQFWPLQNGGFVSGNFVQLVTAADGFHVWVNHPVRGLIDIPSREISRDTLNQAILLSSVVRPLERPRGGDSP